MINWCKGRPPWGERVAIRLTDAQGELEGILIGYWTLNEDGFVIFPGGSFFDPDDLQVWCSSEELEGL